MTLSVTEIDPYCLMAPKRIRNKLGPVIAANKLRYSANHEQILQYCNHIPSPDRSAQLNGRTFTCKLIQHRQQLKPAAIFGRGTVRSGWLVGPVQEI